MLDERPLAHEEMDALAKANAESAIRAGYLCGQCAENLGGKWPKGHRASFHPAKCPICKDCRPIACWDDWNWPKVPMINAFANVSREM